MTISIEKLSVKANIIFFQKRIHQYFNCEGEMIVMGDHKNIK